MRKITIAMLFGGMSSEHEISKVSAQNVINLLSPEKYFVIPVYISKEGRWMLYDGNVDNLANVHWDKQGTAAALSPDATQRGLMRLVGNKVKILPVDVVFPVMHGKCGEDGSVQGLCELAGIPCVGSGILSSAACLDKEFMKIVASSIGIPQTVYITAHKDDLEANMTEIYKQTRYKIGYPCFVKPANGGSSIGITKVNEKSELKAALENASLYDKKFIIERAVVGREFECAVLGNRTPEVSGVAEILPSNEFYDYEAKYCDTGSQTIIDADIADEIKKTLRDYAVRIYQALNCAGMARVDFFYDTVKNRVLFNEINTIPGFTSISMYQMLWKSKGMNGTELVDKLIDLALENK